MLFFLGLLSNLAVAQSQLLSSNIHVAAKSDITHIQINDKALSFLQSEIDLTFASVKTPNKYFHKTFLLNSEGSSISSSYMPSAYYRPNNNMVIITGLSQKPRDSFNPYGATDLTSVVFLSTVNSFISKIRISKRSKIF
jgi:hypothetical protein